MARDLHIQFCTTEEGSRIAYTVQGQGSSLIFPAWWVNHLEVLWEHPTAQSFFERLARDHTVVLYDRQGCGLSDRGRTDYSLESDLKTLETVIDHLKIRRAVLFGFSHGAPAAIAYAVKYPRRVSHLILFGMLDRPLFQGEIGAAVASLLRAHWGLGSRTIADMLLPGADQPTLEWFARWQRESATAEVAIQVASIDYDLTEILPHVRVPTLVMHRQEDTMMPFREGRDLAARIPNARFVSLPGQMHPCFLGEIDPVLRLTAEFLGDPFEPAPRLLAVPRAGPGLLRPSEEPAGASPERLTPREVEVLRRIAAGRTSKEIAAELVVSVHTVERHTANIYRKIDVRGRAEATAYALSRGVVQAG